MPRRLTVAALLASLAALLATSPIEQAAYLRLTGGALPLPEGALPLTLTVDNPSDGPLSVSLYWELSGEASPEASLSLSREEGFVLEAAGSAPSLSGLDAVSCPAGQACTLDYTLAATGDGDGEVVWRGSLRADWSGLGAGVVPELTVDQGAPSP